MRVIAGLVPRLALVTSPQWATCRECRHTSF